MSNPNPVSPRTKAANKAIKEERRSRVAKLALARLSQVEIAKQVGVRQNVVSQDMLALREAWREEHRVSIAQAQEQELAALARDESDLRRRVALLDQEITPSEFKMSDGKVVPIILDKHKSRARYYELILRVMELRARILGTLAPDKIDATISGSVRHEVRVLDLLSDDESRASVERLASKLYAPPPLTITVQPTPPPPTNGTNGTSH